MTRKPGTPLAWSWLSNSTISKFCHLSCMGTVTHYFKALLSSIWLSQPKISKFYQPFTMEFFRICKCFVYFFHQFFRGSRNYIMSIIITILFYIAFLKKIRFFLLAYSWSVVILKCYLYVFYIIFFTMKSRIKSCCCFSVSEETKTEVDTTSITLSYFYHFGNVKKELFRYC